MPETYYIIPKEKHDSLVTKAYLKRGYDAAEAAAGARFCASAAYYGIRTHNAIKALHLDELFGSKVGRWTPGAKIEKLPSRFAAAEIWNGHHKLGHQRLGRVSAGEHAVVCGLFDRRRSGNE